MNISSSYNSHGVSSYTKNAARSDFSPSTPPATSFSSYMDKVSISQKAQNASSVVTDLKEYSKRAHEELLPPNNYDNWLPENLEKLHGIWAEIDKLQAKDGYPDPITRSKASNIKLRNYGAQIAVLEVYGESKIVTDEMMNTGAAAYKEANAEWAYANGYQVEIWEEEVDGGSKALKSITKSIKKIFLKSVYGDPDEVKEKLDDWKKERILERKKSANDDEQHGDK